MTFQETIAEVLYQFSKYCRHHARTALGGAGINQSEAQATLNKELRERLEGMKIKYVDELHGIKIAVNEAIRDAGWQLRSKEEIEAYNQAIDKVIKELGLTNPNEEREQEV